MRTTILYILLILCFQATAQTGKKDNIRITEHKGYSIELPRLNPSSDPSEIENKRGAHVFAERRDVELTPSNSGKWRKIEGVWEWSLEIHSPGAISLNLGFTEYQLPESSNLVIINSEGHKLGPYTKSDNKDHLQLWTPTINGDKIIVKLQVPAGSIDDVKLTLSAVNHGFAQPEIRSGSCNVDVSCGPDGTFPMINNFSEQIRSVAVVQINGTLCCSGFLVNSALNDFRPLFLTAAHCAITERNAATTVFHWNYQNSECREVGSEASGSDGDGSLAQFTRGATVLSRTPNLSMNFIDVDFTLLLLDEPVDPDFQPYFAGWDIRPVIPESTAVVHHPNAEEKRISFDFDSPEIEVIEMDSIFVKVLNWEMGTTEPGSSGSPLFNQDGRAIGHLSGGEASCFNNSFDRFGWIGKAWDNGDSEQTRLRDWLDPDDSGIQFIDGLDGAFSIGIDLPFELLCGVQNPTLQRQITIDENFQGPVELSIIDSPPGLNVLLEKTQLSPGESITLTVENVDALATGTYEVSLLATDGINQNTNEFVLETIQNVTAVVSQESPLQDEALSGSLATFKWEGSADAYELEISENVEFVDPLVREIIPGDLQFSTSNLNGSAEYFWRIRAMNLCGLSIWSDPIKFRTSSLNCAQTKTDNLALLISDQRRDTVEAEINVDVTSPIESVSVPFISGTHTWIADMVFSLISPSGTEVILVANPCDIGVRFQDFEFGFSDAGIPLSDLACPTTDGRIYQPESALSVFNGENPNGTWTLRLIDEFDFDEGFLESFHLEICAASTGQLFTQFAESSFDACATDQIESSFQISNDFTSEVQISTVSVNDILTVAIDNTTAAPGETVNYSIGNLDQLDDMNGSVRFLFTSGEQSSESVVEFNFQSSLPDFDLLLPVNNTVLGIGDDLEFDWEDVPGATGYIFEFSLDDETFADPSSAELPSDESAFTLLLDIFGPDPEPAVVHWRVIALGTDCDRISGASLFTIDIRDGVNELGDLTITIVPNPFQSDILIDFSEATSNEFVVDLFNASGSRLTSHRLQPGSSQLNLDTSDVPPGIYFLRLQSELGVVVEKVVKQQ